MPGPLQEKRRQLYALAVSHSGFFTAAEALRVGYSYPAQKFHADHGNWLRVDRGLFRLPEWPPGEHDSLVRWSLWARGRGVVSHETALAVYQLGDVNPAEVDLTVPPNFRARSVGVRLHHAEMPPSDVTEQQGFRISTPLRSVIDVAAGNLDIDLLAGAVGDALRNGLISRREILGRIDSHGEHAAVRMERALSLLKAAS